MFDVAVDQPDKPSQELEISSAVRSRTRRILSLLPILFVFGCHDCDLNLFNQGGGDEATCGHSFTLHSGAGQAVMVSARLSDNITVSARQTHGGRTRCSDSPLAGEIVNWEVVRGGGIVTPLSPETDAQGLASAVWSLGDAAGEQLLRARLRLQGLGGGADPVVTISAIGLLPTYLAVRVHDGNSQIGSPGQPLAQDVRVRLTIVQPATGTETFFSGDRVEWQVTTGNGTVSNQISGGNGEGVSGTRWTLGPNLGRQTLRARYAGLPQPGSARDTLFADFEAFAQTLPVLVLSVRAGDNQNGTLGGLLPVPVEVEFARKDPATGAVIAPIAGATLNWNVIAGGGSVSQASATTNAQGRGSAQWTLGNSTGVHRLRVATAVDPQAPAGSIFTDTAVASSARIAYAIFDPAAPQPISPFNSNGGPPAVTPLGTGTFRVTFPGQATAAGDAETILVTAFGSGADYCRLISWSNVAQDLVANVGCHEFGGLEANVPFSIMMLGAGVFPGRFAFALADQQSPTGPYASPANRSFNSNGQPITINWLGPGQYSVRFTGNVPAAGPGAGHSIIVTAYGSANTRCLPTPDIAGDVVRVWCHDANNTSDAPAVDSRFTVAMMDQGRPNMRGGFALIPKDVTGTFPATWYSSTGGAVTAARATDNVNGPVIVTFPGLGRAASNNPENVQVVAADNNAATSCKLLSLDVGGTDLRARVQCFHDDGQPDDSRFFIVVIQ